MSRRHTKPWRGSSISSYGAYKRSNVVLPYTALVFDMKLVDIYGYETK